MDLKTLTIKDIHNGLVKREFSAVELCDFYLRRIESQDEEIGAFLELNRDLAIKQAKEIDGLISENKDISLLAGVPAAIKDIILVDGFKCTAGSRMLENYKAPMDATCIARLRKQGVVFLGKTNLDEFAMGSSTEHSAFKITRNPKDKQRVPGGSSGGSAAAVSADECVFSLGSDTGGSIRQPASFCGVVGLKPTYGAVSRYGLIAFASSLDQIGPFAKTAGDVEIVFNAIKGYDKMDSTSVNAGFRVSASARTTSSEFKINDLRIGIPKEYFGEGIDVGVRKTIEETIKKIEKKGAKIKEISLPHSKYSLPCYYIIATSEASANLARFDGIRYGKSESLNNSTVKNIEVGLPKQRDESLIDVYLKTRGEGFGSEVKRRIMLGTFVLSAGYYEAHYLRAQKVRTLIKQDFTEALKKVDFVLTPVSPFFPFKIGEKIEDPLKMYLSDIYTVSVNLAGVPALSLPCPETKGLPVGLQIIGKPFSEPEIFQLAKFIEKL